jgi:NADH-dependant formate dehydrogenase delta subunit FdsD
MPASSTIRKANQIAANLEHLGPDEGARSVAAHIRLYWPPPMRAELVELAEGSDAGLSPLAVAAAQLLVGSQAG